MSMTTTTPEGTELVVPEWTLSDRLEKARETAGLSREEMAEAMGTTVKSIWNWENGVRPRVDLVTFAQRWAEVTRVPVSWLLGLRSSSWNGRRPGQPDDQLMFDYPPDYGEPAPYVNTYSLLAGKVA